MLELEAYGIVMHVNTPKSGGGGAGGYIAHACLMGSHEHMRVILSLLLWYNMLYDLIRILGRGEVQMEECREGCVRVW